MRYIVIAVEDNEAAQLLTDATAEGGGWRLGALLGVKEASIVGLFAVPTKFCDDEPSGHRGKKTDSGFTRGKKYGWWVCGACKKPTKAWATNLNALLSSARNLLENGGILGAARSTPQESSTSTRSLATEDSTIV